MIVNIDKYEGAFCDLEDPGYYVIERDGIDVIKIPKFEVQDKVLQCEFIDLNNEFDEEAIAELIYLVLLKKFCDGYYFDKADFVNFINLKSNHTWRLVYLDI